MIGISLVGTAPVLTRVAPEFAEAMRMDQKVLKPCREDIREKKERKGICIIDVEGNTKPLRSLTRVVFILLRFSCN